MLFFPKDNLQLVSIRNIIVFTSFKFMRITETWSIIAVTLLKKNIETNVEENTIST